MSKKLSQDEISQLLDSIAAGDNESLVPLPDTPLTKMSMKIKPFDFKHPDKFLSKQISEFSNAFEGFIRKFQLFLKSEYGIKAQLHLSMLDQFPFKKFSRALPASSPICTFNWVVQVLFKQPLKFFLKEFLEKLKKKDKSLIGLKQEYLWDTFSSHLRKSFILIFQSWQKKLFQFFQIKNAIAIIVLMILQFNTMIWVLLPLFLLRQGNLKAISIYF